MNSHRDAIHTKSKLELFNLLHNGKSSMSGPLGLGRLLSKLLFSASVRLEI